MKEDFSPIAAMFSFGASTSTALYDLQGLDSELLLH